MRSGVYRLRPGADPEFLRDGLYLTDLAAPGEALVVTRDPTEPVSAAREFARVLFRSSGGEAEPGLSELVAALR